MKAGNLLTNFLPQRVNGMDFISGNRVKDKFGIDMILEPGANGEEYRLFGGILSLIYQSAREQKQHPYQFGSCNFYERFSGAKPYLASEHREFPHFPDCLFVNDDYVLCIEHFQVNASEPRSDYDCGDEYRAFLESHRDLVEQNSYEELEALIEEEELVFSIHNLILSLLHSLESKAPKIPLYKQAAREYISTGVDESSVKEDLAKRMEVWFLVEDVTPSTAAESLFSNNEVLDAIKGIEELEGLIYVHTPFITKPPKTVGEIMLIHNDEDARAQLRALLPCNSNHQ